MSSQIEEIKNRIDIVELISSYLRLQKAGDHFTFLQEIDGIEFGEALKTLAERAGVELRPEDREARSERDGLFKILEEAAKFFESNLATGLPSGNPVASGYLKSRGVTDETMKEFRLGYAPAEWKMLFNHLLGKGFKPDEMERAGVILKSSSYASASAGRKNYFDRFRGRIIFPILDYNGRVIAFGGRIYPEKENEAKYVNSPETAFYQKSRILYGLNKSKQEILRTGECVLVEGYMDMVMSWQSGVKNVAASSGTALTLEQLKLLSSLCGKIILAFDIDVAGEAANKRGVNLLKNILEQNLEFDVKVVKLDKFKDAADAVKEDPAVC